MGGGAAFGQNSIISAVMLTASLTTCHQGKERKSNVNAPYFQRFETWLRGLNLTPGRIYGWPDFIIDWAGVSSCGGCIARKLDDENDDENDEPC
jgi:hypothetical protein